MSNIREKLKEAVKLTLEYHETLNPKLWDGQTLKSEVAKKLLMIAQTWAGFAKIPVKAISDIIVVGGNANYNYTPFSDIDLHVVVDIEKLPECNGLLDEYLRGKKQLWGLVHDITIYGHNVELYAQDQSVPYTKNQGVYSVKYGKWLAEPKRQKVNLDDPAIKQKVNHYAEKIDTLISSGAEDSALQQLKDKFRDMRASALKRGGEFSVENLVFKELRNLGYIDKVTEYIRSKQDQRLSL